MSTHPDLGSYNLNDPQDVEKFFLASHAELMSMYSRMVADLDKLNDFIHQIDLYTAPKNLINSLADLVESQYNIHGVITKYFDTLIKMRDTNLLTP
jgi:hypothetical protein